MTILYLLFILLLRPIVRTKSQLGWHNLLHLPILPPPVTAKDRHCQDLEVDPGGYFQGIHKPILYAYHDATKKNREQLPVHFI